MAEPAVKLEGDWQAIGSVVGTASHAAFSFVLKNYRGRVGDVVAVRMRIPSDEAGTEKDSVVWGRVTGISRFNPFFPTEAALELAGENLRPSDTVLSTTRDQVQADCIVLGYTLPGDPTYEFRPLTYPVEPASTVLRPPASALSGLLTGPAGAKEAEVPIGHVASRPDVNVNLRVGPLISRHMAILAMTGGGKTVAARTIIHDLAEKGYPVLILDPHGDYLGFYDNRLKLPKGSSVRVFFPHISLSPENSGIVPVILEKMTAGQTEAQRSALEQLLKDNPITTGHTLGEYFGLLRGKAAQKANSEGGAGQSKASLFVIMRQLSIVEAKLREMGRMNESIRERIRNVEFEQLPDSHRAPSQIISPNQVSILYLGGYDHLTQSTIVSIVLENLFGHRARLDDEIPPFLTVVEEAHNFIPGGTESQEETPSLETLRKVITEGRKFGTGLLLVSQRPSRLDATLLSQCNTFMVMRLVNPNDQNFVRRVMENMSDEDAALLPAFGPGSGIVSGQAVRFPLVVNVDRHQEFESSRMGQEDFLTEAANWEPPRSAAKARESDARQAKRARRRQKRSN